MFQGAAAFDEDITEWTMNAGVVTVDDMFNGATRFLNQYTRTPANVNGPPTAWQVNSVAPFADRAALVVAITNCLQVDSTGATCCSRSTGPADCGAAGQGLSATDMSRWNVGLVTDFKQLFKDETDFNQDIGRWESGLVTDMDEMFSGASSFNQDISAWDTSAVTLMGQMFKNAIAFVHDITRWETPNLLYPNAGSGLGIEGDFETFLGATAFLAAFTNCDHYLNNNNPVVPASAAICVGTYEQSNGPDFGPPGAWQLNTGDPRTSSVIVTPATPATTTTTAHDGYKSPATCSQTCKECNKFRWYIKTVPKSTPTSATRNLRRSACQRCRDCRRT